MLKAINEAAKNGNSISLALCDTVDACGQCDTQGDVCVYCDTRDRCTLCDQEWCGIVFDQI